MSRALKGAFNERPPQPKYTFFWDVDQVISFLSKLGSNEVMSLQQITLKLVMLMALTTPSRSADLSQLDIKHRSYSPEGVLFQPVHLSKQSRQNKLLADFFFPAFRTDKNLCMVSALRIYEDRTLSFHFSMEKLHILDFFSL